MFDTAQRKCIDLVFFLVYGICAIVMPECSRYSLAQKGNLQDIKNWRPVSLLFLDYKILSKALAIRLKEAMEQVLHWDQTYCVPGRSMVVKVHLIQDVLKVSGRLGIHTGLISLDQEKAELRTSSSGR